jgi:hypothetical protein
MNSDYSNIFYLVNLLGDSSEGLVLFQLRELLLSFMHENIDNMVCSVNDILEFLNYDLNSEFIATYLFSDTRYFSNIADWLNSDYYKTDAILTKNGIKKFSVCDMVFNISSTLDEHLMTLLSDILNRFPKIAKKTYTEFDFEDTRCYIYFEHAKLTKKLCLYCAYHERNYFNLSSFSNINELNLYLYDNVLINTSNGELLKLKRLVINAKTSEILKILRIAPNITQLTIYSSNVNLSEILNNSPKYLKFLNVADDIDCHNITQITKNKSIEEIHITNKNICVLEVLPFILNLKIAHINISINASIPILNQISHNVIRKMNKLEHLTMKLQFTDIIDVFDGTGMEIGDLLSMYNVFDKIEMNNFLKQLKNIGLLRIYPSQNNNTITTRKTKSGTGTMDWYEHFHVDERA